MQLEFGYRMARHKLLTVAFLCYAVGAFAQKIDLSAGAKAEFDAIGKPAMINIKGTGAKAQGVLTVSSGAANGDFSLNLKSFTTDMDLRDEHMKEKYLEVDKPGHETAKVKIDQKVNVPEIPQNGIWEPKELKGVLTLHGVTREVPITCRLTIKDYMASGVVSFKIKVQDFKIEIPSFAGVTMADEVDVKVFVNHKVLQ